jgi:hypothetical protein
MTTYQIECSDREAKACLEKLYGTNCLFLQRVTAYSAETLSICADFMVPKSVKYSQYELSYVTAENFVRCNSELLYALFALSCVHSKRPELYECGMSVDALASKGRLKYRDLRLKFHRDTQKGESFRLSAQFTKIRKVKNEFLVLESEGTGPIDMGCRFIAKL